MKTNILAVPLLVGALAFAGCSAHVNDNGPRGGASTGRVDSGSGSMSGSASGSGSGSASGSMSGTDSGGTSGSISGSGSGSGSGSVSGSGTIR